MGPITVDPWAMLERGTFIGALLAFIAAIFMGWIITSRQLDRELAAKDKLIEKLEKENAELKVENKQFEMRMWEMFGLLKKSTTVAEKNSSIAEATINKSLSGQSDVASQ